MTRVGTRVRELPGDLGGARTWVLLLVTVLALVGGGVLSSGNGPAADAGAAGSDSEMIAVPRQAVTTAVSSNAALPPEPPRCTQGSIELTFDDGPHPARTPAILDLLAAWGARATFFVIGEEASAHPDILRRQAREGHRVGNHTWSHPYLTQSSADEVRDELQRTSELIAEVTGEQPTLWRPPYGDRNAEVIREASEQGLEMVLWQDGTDSRDWEGLTAQQIATRVVDNSEDGSIVLMHDIHQNALDALPLVLQGLRAKGLCAQ